MILQSSGNEFGLTVGNLALITVVILWIFLADCEVIVFGFVLKRNIVSQIDSSCIC